MLKNILVTAELLTAVPLVIAAEAPDTSTWAQLTSFTCTGKAIAPLRAVAKHWNVQLQKPLPEKLNHPQS